MIDLATLTGAVVVALGDYYAGVMANDEEWVGADSGRGRGEWRSRLATAPARHVQAALPLDRSPT